MFRSYQVHRALRVQRTEGFQVANTCSDQGQQLAADAGAHQVRFGLV